MVTSPRLILRSGYGDDQVCLFVNLLHLCIHYVQLCYVIFKKNIANPLKCSSLFYIGIRKFNVIHAQLRMNCSNLNAHLHSLHVIDSPACVCSHSIEDTAHFFLYCPLYYTRRLARQNIVSRYTEFKLETLLFGDTDIDNVDNITNILTVHD